MSANYNPANASNLYFPKMFPTYVSQQVSEALFAKYNSQNVQSYQLPEMIATVVSRNGCKYVSKCSKHHLSYVLYCVSEITNCIADTSCPQLYSTSDEQNYMQDSATFLSRANARHEHVTGTIANLLSAQQTQRLA